MNNRKGGLVWGFIILIVVLLLVYIGWSLGVFDKIIGSVIYSVSSCDEGIIAYYWFEDNVLDSANGNNGQMSGVVFSEGKFGQGVQFDGDDEEVSRLQRFLDWLRDLFR